MIPHKNSKIPPDQVSPLYINGLNGRFLRIPNKKKNREIMLIYGHHTSLERMYPMALSYSKFGVVTMPDLPGFGGMDSLYKIDEEPSIDTLADYLAAVVKLHYKKRQVTLVGFSLGFPIITRMLQKYPDLGTQVDILISVAGFTTHDDFKIPKNYFLFLKHGAMVFTGRWTAKVYRLFALNRFAIKFAYQYSRHARQKLSGLSRSDKKKMLDFEVELWQNNDARSYMRTAVSMFTFDLTKWRVGLTAHHVSFGIGDQYLDEAVVEQHMKVIYDKLIVYRLNRRTHMPSEITDQLDADKLIPKKLRSLLNK